MKKTIRIAVKGVTEFIDIEDLSEFQEDLKTATDEELAKLRGEILENGFTCPFAIWHNGGKNWILDGHQRKKVLTLLREEGYEIPKMPVVNIVAKTRKIANRILGGMVSQYGKVTAQGAMEWMSRAGLTIDEMKGCMEIPNLDMGKFEKAFFAPPVNPEREGVQEIPEGTYSNLVHECPKCHFRFGKGVKE